MFGGIRREQSSRTSLSLSLCLTALGIFALLLLSGCGEGSGLDTDKVELGQAIYADNCQSCHGDAASGDQALPDAPVHSPQGHTWHHADGQLADIIMGRLSYPGRTMPSFVDTLSEDEVDAILAYFKSNWKSEQIDFQAEVSKNWESLQN